MSQEDRSYQVVRLREDGPFFEERRYPGGITTFVEEAGWDDGTLVAGWERDDFRPRRKDSPVFNEVRDARGLDRLFARGEVEAAHAAAHAAAVAFGLAIERARERDGE